MDPNQGESLLSSGSSLPRNVNNINRRHLCFCGEEVVIISSSTMADHGRRYVACGRMSKCTLFEWIDEDEGLKGGWAMSNQRRVRCFCGESLTLRTSGTTRNPNRRFISCPNRRCKFFELVDKDDKFGSMKLQSATGRQRPSTLDAVNLGTMEEYAILEAQEGKINRLSVDVERLGVEIRQLDDCVGRLCTHPAVLFFKQKLYSSTIGGDRLCSKDEFLLSRTSFSSAKHFEDKKAAKVEVCMSQEDLLKRSIIVELEKEIFFGRVKNQIVEGWKGHGKVECRDLGRYSCLLSFDTIEIRDASLKDPLPMSLFNVLIPQGGLVRTFSSQIWLELVGVLVHV
ncbi:hypothetical protein PIB30_077730 [Stylosanthes scabra]|uniref:GRF-type domain-containing protein n=1 Tax=Stylosanthes scabra TaxID=79078 RepID=A0ABU6QRA5_9FABA|nr:hypothetical protein [Stylosanthes scabra]